MYEIFKEVVKDLTFDLKIVSHKHSNTKTDVELEFGGIRTKVELRNTCTPGEERNYCWNVVATAMSNIFVIKGDLELARIWMDSMHDRSLISPENS